MIGQKNTKVFWHQSEARTGLTVWNWSVKTLSPGALLFVLDVSYFFSPVFRLFLAPTNCPWVSEDGSFHGTYTKHGPGSMDHPMDLVHGPGPWTTSNFQLEIAPVNMKIYRRSGYKQKHRLIFIAYVLEGLSCNSGLLWDHGAPINSKTTNSF